MFLICKNIRFPSPKAHILIFLFVMVNIEFVWMEHLKISWYRILLSIFVLVSDLSNPVCLLRIIALIWVQRWILQKMWYIGIAI